ncbi:MAG: hypothetical protein ACRD0K_10505 [Egibacteraceae bacterium]
MTTDEAGWVSVLRDPSGVLIAVGPVSREQALTIALAATTHSSDVLSEGVAQQLPPEQLATYLRNVGGRTGANPRSRTPLSPG